MGEGRRHAADGRRRTATGSAPCSRSRLQSRGGVGIINIQTSDRNGKVVGMAYVSEDDEVMLISQQGMILRMKAGDVRVIGRATQGVRLIEMEEGDQVVAIAKLLERDDEPANGSAPPEATPAHLSPSATQRRSQRKRFPATKRRTRSGYRSGDTSERRAARGRRARRMPPRLRPERRRSLRRGRRGAPASRRTAAPP